MGRLRAGFSALIALAFAMALGAHAVRSQEPPSARRFYDAALAGMQNLPQPRYVEYAMTGEGLGLAVDLEVRDHLVWLQMTNKSPGSYAGTVTWQMQHRTVDYATQIVTEDGRRYVSTRAFFDPTWYGGFRALREGMLFYQRTDLPVASLATPEPGPSPDLHTIAVVSVIGTNIYNVEDRGPAPCANGDPGHALHLVPRDRNPRHQLNYVVVDTVNDRFCTIRFDTSQGRETSGYVEQHYADVNGYWLQTDGVIDNAVRAYGVLVTSGTWTYKIAYKGFPKTIADGTFVPPADQ